MSFPRILPFAALLLACNAMAGFYATAALAAILESLPVSESCVDTAALGPASAANGVVAFTGNAGYAVKSAPAQTGCDEQTPESLR